MSMKDIGLIAQLRKKIEDNPNEMFIWVALKDANRLQELNHEGHFGHRNLLHGYNRHILTALLDHLEVTVPNEVADKLLNS